MNATSSPVFDPFPNFIIRQTETKFLRRDKRKKERTDVLLPLLIDLINFFLREGLGED